MNYYVSYILSLLIIIPATIGWVRFKKISPAYVPFLLWLSLGFLNETVSFVLVIVLRQYNIVNSNIYLLLESLLILWQFNRWHLFEKRVSYILFVVFFIIVWLIENLFISKLYLGFNSYFHIIYAFIIVLMRERNSLLKSPEFMLSALFVILFTYGVLVETFWTYGLKMSSEFSKNMQHIFVFINLFCYVIFALVILWMPKRQAFTLQF